MRFFGSQGLYIQLKVFFNHFLIISLSFWDLPKYHLFIIYLSFIYHLFIIYLLIAFGGIIVCCVWCMPFIVLCFCMLSLGLCVSMYIWIVYMITCTEVSKSNVLLLFVGTSSYIWHVLLHMWMYQLYIALHHMTLHVHVHLHYITYIPTYIHTYIHTYIKWYVHWSTKW